MSGKKCTPFTRVSVLTANWASGQSQGTVISRVHHHVLASWGPLEVPSIRIHHQKNQPQAAFLMPTDSRINEGSVLITCPGTVDKLWLSSAAKASRQLDRFC